jgi:hypothetical protein
MARKHRGYILVTAAALVAAACVGVGSARAVEPGCVIIDDGGHCAPPGYLNPNGGSTATEPEFQGAEGRRCYRGWDAWYRGSTGYGRGLTINATWCSNSGRNYLVSFSFGREQPHQWLCTPSDFSSYTVSGGISRSWITKHYEIHYSCMTPWFFPISDRIWFNVRYGTYGLHYMTDWNGR